MEKIIIVGAGVSGLSCLNAFLDKGISPLLLEGSNIGTPKMCGEFIAPKAVECLLRWDISKIEKINQVSFLSSNHQLNFVLPKPGGSIPRARAELQLAKRAKEKGGRIRENTPIERIIPPKQNEAYMLYLKTGEELKADTVIFATGKYHQSNKSVHIFPYLGIKCHVRKVIKPNTLMIHACKKAYFGCISISDEYSNFACLIKKEELEQGESGKAYLTKLAKSNTFLSQLLQNNELIENWLEAYAPEFQLKRHPNWPRAFWIGDALANIYPAIGSGFAHGIVSGIMAANYYAKSNPSQFKKHSTSLVKPKLKIGKMVHHLLLNPKLGFIPGIILKHSPFILKRILKKLEFF